MNKLILFLEEKVSPVAQKIGGQRHMLAVRKGIISTLPLTLVGSFFVIFLNFPIPSIAEKLAPYLPILDIPYRFTVGILALYATFGIATSLAKSYKLDTLTAGIVAVMSFIVTSIKPVRLFEEVAKTTVQTEVVPVGRYLNIANLGAQSLFGAIVTAIISVEIYRFMKEKNITIKMPEGVPPEVSNSFVALMPAATNLILFWVIRHMLGFDINATLSNLLMPLQSFLAGNSLFGGLVTVFLICFFWILGIHGPAIMGPVIRPFWETSIAENMDAFANNTPATQMPNIFTEMFLQWFVWIGGAGATLALVCLFLRSKSAYLKELGKIGFLPGLFNINEPIIFGAPIVMNPTLAIPFVLSPLVMTVIAYIATITHLIPMTVSRTVFTVPSPIGAMMVTNWHIIAAILVVVNFFVSLVIYYPFFKVFEKQQLISEEGE
ncbi:PTS system, cellobiose-specific IIC component [Pilibacter termitis]|uniref:Permease IIC component n=1 Tax=Pilibacter termitis TaxID=263852 RepID=A0A1T4NXS8_9ENTE|nr:PTS sugar transporter subunit IIC [Pilibacter termitis]SJZ83872.1 PTS system, cellobiose-specific IIC component [Pilibacter termitis]